MFRRPILESFQDGAFSCDTPHPGRVNGKSVIGCTVLRMTTPSTTRGRPCKPDVRSKVVGGRFTERQYRALLARAREQGLDPATWLHQLAVTDLESADLLNDDEPSFGEGLAEAS